MKYDTADYKKHKRPGGWGSPCPDDVGVDTAQNLLDTSSEVDGCRYSVEGTWCYRAFSHGVDSDGKELWHGHPIPWTRLPPSAKNDLIERGLLTSAVYRKAIRKSWGSELDE